MENTEKKFTSYEPLRTNRWLLKIGTVPQYLLKNVKLNSFKEKEEFYTKLTFAIYNAVHYMIVPDDIITLRNIKLEFLDPTGVVLNGYDMKVEFENMWLDCDYANNSILTHEFSFWVKNLDQLYVNVEENSEKEIIEKWKVNKKSTTV